jgi:hypothetical protein
VSSSTVECDGEVGRLVVICDVLDDSGAVDPEFSCDAGSVVAVEDASVLVDGDGDEDAMSLDVGAEGVVLFRRQSGTGWIGRLSLVLIVVEMSEVAFVGRPLSLSAMIVTAATGAWRRVRPGRA